MTQRPKSVEIRLEATDIRLMAENKRILLILKAITAFYDGMCAG